MFSLLLYSPDSRPRYFEISRTFFKFFFLGLPFLTVLAFLAISLGTVYFKQLKLMTVRREPQLIQTLREENSAIKTQLTEAEALGQELQEKLMVTPQDAAGTFSFFKPTLGQRELTQNPRISVENINVLTEGNNTRLQFRIVNQGGEGRRTSGFVFIILKTKNSYIFWPEKENSPRQMQYQFNEGEFFATSRFRPVNASFPLFERGSTVAFQIVIFSNTGDILHRGLHSVTIDD